MSQNRARGKYRGGGESYRGRQYHDRGQTSDVRPSGYGSKYSEGPSHSETDQQRGRGFNRGRPIRGRRGQGFRGNHRGEEEAPICTNILPVPDDPVTGTKGKDIILRANYLPLNLENFFKKEIFQYDVTIEPSKYKRLLPKVMEKFKLENFSNTCTVFDGTKFLLSPKKFNSEYCGEVTLKIDGYNEPITFSVRVQFIKQIDLTLLKCFNKELNSKNSKNLNEAFQAISIVLKGFPLMKHLSVGKNFYIRPERTIHLTHGMELLYGLHQAPVITQRGPMLNVDVLYKAHPIEYNKVGQEKAQYKKLLDLICEVCKIQDVPEMLTDEQLNRVLDVIKDKKVSYTVRGNTMNYKVNGFRKSPIVEVIPNENMTVQNYFSMKKQYTIKHRNLQLLWVGKQKKQIPILIPVELCQFDITQKSKQSINPPEVVKQIIKYTKSSTEERQQKIMEMVKTVGNYEESTYLKQFGIEVGTEFELVRGRVLNPPDLEYSNARALVKNGKWDIKGKQFMKPCVINEWAIINLSNEITQVEIRDFQREMDNLAKKFGIKISPVRTVEHLVQRQNFVFQLNKKFQQLKSYDLLIVILSDKNTYHVIKQIAEVQVGCLTQCILDETIKQRPIATKVSNLLQKINAKCNGINHILTTRPSCLKGNVMFMGADVTHPPPGSHCIPSYAAVTASYDADFFKFSMKAQVQTPTEENIIGLKEIIIKQLQIFHSETNKKIDHIIFFRDGVSEGQFDTIRKNEVQALIDACKTLKYNPSITFIVVMKRHHTRLFPTNIEDTYDKNHNVPAGTCVDSGITHPKEMNLKDFFLNSHAAIQGVSKPTKYCTIHDDENFTYDDIEEIAYYLCHMYARCTRSVSYPAPTYYAHLAAERAKVLCQNNPIDWTNLIEKGKIEIPIKNVTPMHFV